MLLHMIKGFGGKFEVDPAFPDDLEMAKGIKAGSLVEFKASRPRNPAFHRKFFSLMNVVLENQDSYDNMDLLLKEVKIRIGHYDEMVIDGKYVCTPKSISFASMDDAEFSVFYNKVLQCVLLNFFDGLSAAEIDIEVDKRLGFA